MTNKLEKDQKVADLLKCVEKIALGAKGSEIDKEFLHNHSSELSILSGFLEITDRQAAIFCVVLNINFGNTSVDLDQIAGYIGCNPISILNCLPELDEMVSKRIMCRHENSRRRSRVGSFNINNIEFYVNKEVLDSLRKGVTFKKKIIDIPDVPALLAHLISIFCEYQDGEYTYNELLFEIKSTLSANSTLPFVKGLEEYSLSDEDIVFFMFICSEFMDNDEPVDLLVAIRYLYTEIRDRMRVRKEFLRGTHTLLKAGLVKLEDGHFRSDKHLILTDAGIDLLLQDDKDLYVVNKEKKKKNNYILASQITKKEMYFSGKETKSLDFLADTLKPENHATLVKRMKDAGMRTGVAVLLYGPPGTGKTESVYQLARRTGRDIHMISISETKSMWFGESEKLIKKVFDEYRALVKKNGIAPILLFNEADGIFSSRKKIGSSPVAQTENAIQNIILQEMEDLEGILIATTNLTQNLDQAFERRFLYKICFEKPGTEARISIWQDKIKNLCTDDACQLSKAFDLSGGQIENIARKYLLQLLLTGTFPALSEIEAFCQEEQINRTVIQKIGFNRDPKETRFRNTG
ncbi:MAG: ATP-binding protein [Bacteroidota bacterium]